MLAAACTGGDTSDGADDSFDGTVRIGAALSEAGRFAAEGKAVRQGYETWLHWVNEEHGGIRVGDGRYRAEIVYLDDQSDPGRIEALTEQLIEEHEVDFLLGPYSSTLTGAVGPGASLPRRRHAHHCGPSQSAADLRHRQRRRRGARTHRVGTRDGL